MIILRIAFLIAVIIACFMYSLSLPAKFMIIGFALSIANSGLHGRSSGTIDTIGGVLTWIGIAMFIYSAIMH